LSRRDSNVLGLRSVEGITESPTAERFVARAVAALGEVARQARVALPAGRDGAHQHAIAQLYAADANSDLGDHSDRLVTDREPVLDRVLAADDVEIRPADGREGHPHDRFAGTGARDLDFFEAEAVHAAEHVRFHGRHTRGRSMRRAKDSMFGM
jgi:hypothetical protein